MFRTDARIDFIPENPTAGLIFYPGGKMQYEAYAPLLAACSERGTLCVLLRMPFNLAVLDMNAADGVVCDYPEITGWYIRGHSLGGAMAGAYVEAHTEELRGLALLAAYSTKDLSDSGLRILSVYGSEDGVLNREAYTDALEDLPGGWVEMIIDGGCHAYFCSYGPQAGDGTPSISREEQILQTAEAIAAFAVCMAP